MTTRVIFGGKVANRDGDVWGLDKEGKRRAIWWRSGHAGLDFGLWADTLTERPNLTI
jgi:hypothetical protein